MSSDSMDIVRLANGTMHVHSFVQRVRALLKEAMPKLTESAIAELKRASAKDGIAAEPHRAHLSRLQLADESGTIENIVRDVVNSYPELLVTA